MRNLRICTDDVEQRMAGCPHRSRKQLPAYSERRCRVRHREDQRLPRSPAGYNGTGKGSNRIPAEQWRQGSRHARRHRRGVGRYAVCAADSSSRQRGHKGSERGRYRRREDFQRHPHHRQRHELRRTDGGHPVPVYWPAAAKLVPEKYCD